MLFLFQRSSSSYSSQSSRITPNARQERDKSSKRKSNLNRNLASEEVPQVDIGNLFHMQFYNSHIIHNFGNKITKTKPTNNSAVSYYTYIWIVSYFVWLVRISKSCSKLSDKPHEKKFFVFALLLDGKIYQQLARCFFRIYITVNTSCKLNV